jgi:AraC family transcriptional regulator of adaptative response / DNA-3-methyladenine glycosylase II
MELDPEVCYRALAARDPRFDGVFFVGVRTTRIYCRPVCTARTPGRDRCRFFPSAAAAERAGFRPCLRCRPELAPGNAPVDATGRVARAAAARIEAGALDDGGRLDALADELGLSTRQLRRAVRKELGVSPVELAQTHRLLLAKQLLTETRLPMIEVAFASGFASVRRFNALFRSHYRLTPSQVRRAKGPGPVEESLRLRLAYRPPLAWAELLRFLAGRALAGIEWVTDSCYARTVALGKHRGWLRVEAVDGRHVLAVELAPSLVPVLAPLLARLRHLFDLSARPDVIVSHLGADAAIGPAVRRCPGLRVPGAFHGFELAARAVLGQQVSVRAATTIAGRLVAAFGDPIATPFPELTRLSPSAGRLARADVGELAALGLPRRRAETLRALAAAAAAGQLPLDPGPEPEDVIDRLRRLPGVGEWTAQYVAMRAARWPDAFPHDDLGLRRGTGEASARRLRQRAEAWRPWRAYAAMHLWHTSTLVPQEGARRA